jgi:hypothetical protein
MCQLNLLRSEIRSTDSATAPAPAWLLRCTKAATVWFCARSRSASRGFLGFILLTTAAVTPALGQTLPPDASAICTVPSTTFNTWFQSGSPSLNGVVNPANSITFTNPLNNCPFYQWAEQMFMWLTSPAPTAYGAGSRVFDTSVFYDVSPPDSSGNRTFLPHVPGFVRPLPLRSAQAGPHGLQVIVAKAGGILEVIHPPLGPNGKPLVRNTAGRQVEVQNVKIGPANQAIFIDTAGKTIRVPVVKRGQRVPIEQVLPELRIQAPKSPAIAKANAQLLENLDPARTVQKFILPGHIIFVNLAGNIVDVEQGQAGDSSVLLSQSNNLVYYAAIVNDVYAYFLTGNNNGIPAQTQFPTTQAVLDEIQTFAAAHGGPNPFTDGIALTMEIKTAWVEASTLSDPSSYITTTGQIPVYNAINPNSWVASGTTKTTTLALVGMHVVGTVNGHPEMIWATFEHIGNTPLATFPYLSGVAQTPATGNVSTSGSWLFSVSNVSNTVFTNSNIPHADYLKAPNIESANGFTISASNTIRTSPFGVVSNQIPTPLVTSVAEANTQIISINNNIQGMMTSAGAGADVRNNYVMYGATWTAGGVPPSGQFASGGNEVGTSNLQNSAMETYQQGTNTTSAGVNCLDCHSGNMLGTKADNQGAGLSHIFGVLAPLHP